MQIYSFLIRHVDPLTRNSYFPGGVRLSTFPPPLTAKSPAPRLLRVYPHPLARPAPTRANYINGLRSKAGKVRAKDAWEREACGR